MLGTGVFFVGEGSVCKGKGCNQPVRPDCSLEVNQTELPITIEP